jgi:succinate dehydrogenase / fumarate reductase, cytochrome b subunit
VSLKRSRSPHLTVYKFKYTLFTSILNRATGLALSFGFLVLLYWVMSVFRGPQRYAEAQVVLSHPIFKLLLSGFIFAFCYHLIAGVRHLIWDTGRGLERTQSQKSAWAIGMLSVLLTLAIACWAFWPRALT